MNFIKKTTSYFLLSVLAISLLITGCRETEWDNHTSGDSQVKSEIMKNIESQADLSTFTNLLKATGYNELLMTSNNFTVFAPTNDAWAGVDTQDVESMKKIVSTLIVYNSYYSDKINATSSIKAVNGKLIEYNAENATFNGAKIIRADIRSANGVIHVTDKIIERRENIWDYLSTKTDYLQFQFINSMDKRIMDEEKSINIGVYPDGKTKYDTVWKHVNNFLEKYPIQNEDSVYTYIVVENDGFNMLYDKYKKYFSVASALKADTVTRYNVCQDFVFKGKIDINNFDTLTNIDGVKVPIKGSTIISSYTASNGRVYVINQSNIKLREKIKTIKIEGENFSDSDNSSLIFTRYKLWASGERDIAYAGSETQSDSLWSVLTGLKDSIISKTYSLNGSYIGNISNFHIEYKTQVNSANYDVYYVAHDDIADHYDLTNTRRGTYKLVQKLFISMPGAAKLRYGITDNTRGVANNFLGASKCFVGEGIAGVRQITKLRQRELVPTTQLVDLTAQNSNVDILPVTRYGEMTMWLCNTALSNTANKQGLLFLDYILLVPRITEE